MDNQHRKIKGYRELTAADIEKMNVVKNAGAGLGELIDVCRKDGELDQRWVSIAATHFQEGLMALTRSVAKPDFF